MVHFSTIIVLASSFVAFASPVGKRTVAQVEADITTISNDVNTLDAAVNAFPNSGGTLAAALAINTDSTNLDTAIKQGTTDAAATGPVSEADGTTIINAVEAIQPKIIDALNTIVAKKPAFDGLPLGGVSALVKQDLTTLNTDTKAFENALIAIAPADLIPQANSITSAIDAAFTTALNAYASA